MYKETKYKKSIHNLCILCRHSNGINKFYLKLDDIIPIVKTKQFGDKTYCDGGMYYPVNLKNEKLLTERHIIPWNKDIDSSKECKCECHIVVVVEDA